MRQFMAVAAVLFLTAGAFGRDKPSWVNWSGRGAYQQDNGRRGKIILNATWRWQPCVNAQDKPDPDAWLYWNVPGFDRSVFFVRDAERRICKTWKGRPITGKEPCWQEREFTVPAAWKGRRVFIDIFCMLGNARVLLDGRLLAEVEHAQPVMLALPEPIRFNAPYRLTIKCRNIMDDVWLRSFPVSAMIDNAYLTTSFRQKQLRLKVSGSGLPVTGGSLRLTVAEKPDCRLVRKTAVLPVRISGQGKWSIQAGVAWKDPKPWSPEHPHLYWYKLELLDQAGKVLDATLPRRFGFREIWIQGGDLMLNDKPIRFIASQISPFNWASGSGNNRLAAKTHDYVRKVLTTWKKIGLNACMLWGPGKYLTPGEPVLDVADEMGYLVVTQAFPGKVKWKMGEDIAVAAASQAEKDKWRYRAGRYVRRYRHHPSLIIWHSGTGGSQIWDYCPATLDGSRDPAKDWPERMKKPVAAYKRVAALWNELDGARPVTWYSSEAACNPVVSTMGYLGFDMDLQERENWPLAWSKKRHKPLWNSEFGMPFSLDWVTRDARRPTRRNRARPLYLEYSAMYFGDRFYQDEPEALLRFLGNVKADSKLVRFASWRALKALFITHTIRAWRTYGVSMGIFGEQRYWYEPGSVFASEAAGVDPRRPGATPDIWKRIDARVGTDLNQVGKTAQESLRPLYVYLGGDRHFTRKDHAFFSGQTVLKHVVVINDTEESVTLTGVWKLVNADGQAAAAGSFAPFTVKAGARSVSDLKIRFPAPLVKRSATFSLGVRMQAKVKGRLADRMELRVFPKRGRARVKLKYPLYCFDPVGHTHAMLRRAGIACEMITTLSEVDARDALLVIGRHCLEQEAVRNRLAGEFDRRVEQGLRVLIFEQAADNLMGLRLEETSPRRTFIRARGHPVLAGIEDADLWYWRGESDLIKPYADPLDPFGGQLPPTRSGWKGYPQRLWKWGNDNAVATYVIIKPQAGACRALVDSGFDLMETPLLETTRGKGRIIFCQMDVTNRYGVDPVATRIVDNLFDYLREAPPPNPDLVEPLIPKPAGRFSGMRARVPAGKLGWGISAADMFFRQKVDLPAMTGPEDNPVLVAWNEVAGARQAACTMMPKLLPTGWQKVKAMRVLAALRVNQGGSSKFGPRLGLQGDDRSLYPVRWRDGFVHPYAHWRW